MANIVDQGHTVSKEQNYLDLHYLLFPQIQRCQTCIPVIPYILYYKVYNSSCIQVGHNLIDNVQSLPEQIIVMATICKHILCDEVSASCSGIDASMQWPWSIRFCPTW